MTNQAILENATAQQLEHLLLSLASRRKFGEFCNESFKRSQREQSVLALTQFFGKLKDYDMVLSFLNITNADEEGYHTFLLLVQDMQQINEYIALLSAATPGMFKAAA